MAKEKLSDPKTYRDLNVPFESQEASEVALRAFIDGVIELRKQHRIADVSLVWQVPFMSNDEESTGMGSMHLGNSLNAEALLAHGLGHRQAERKNEIGKLLAGK